MFVDSHRLNRTVAVTLRQPTAKTPGTATCFGRITQPWIGKIVAGSLLLLAWVSLLLVLLCKLAVSRDLKTRMS